MTLEKISQAYTVLAKLVGFQFPVKKAYEIYKLTKIIEEQHRFAASEEMKYITEAGGIINPDGTLSFDTPEKLAAYMERALALHEMEVALDFHPVSLSENDLGAQTISPADIYNLEGFVSFNA